MNLKENSLVLVCTVGLSFTNKKYILTWSLACNFSSVLSVFVCRLMHLWLRSFQICLYQKEVRMVCIYKQFKCLKSMCPVVLHFGLSLFTRQRKQICKVHLIFCYLVLFASSNHNSALVYNCKDQG